MVRRKELKEKLSKNSQSDKNFEPASEAEKSIIGEKRKLENTSSNLPEKEDQPNEKKSKKDPKQYVLEPGSVMTMSTETDTLTKDIIKVLTLCYCTCFILNTKI